MDLIAQVSNQTIAPMEQSFELFKLVTLKDADDNDVVVKQSIGTFRKSDLENQIKNLQGQIAELQAKIDSIDMLVKPSSLI